MHRNFTITSVYSALALLLFAQTSSADSWYVQKASSQWQATNTAVTISYGRLLATGTTKVHLSLDQHDNALAPGIFPTVRSVSVHVGEDQILASDCTIRRHNSDGSGTLHGFDTLTQRTGYDDLSRSGSISVTINQQLQVECSLQTNDVIHGASYKTDLDP